MCSNNATKGLVGASAVAVSISLVAACLSPSHDDRVSSGQDGPVACPATLPVMGVPCGLDGLQCVYDEKDACGYELDPLAWCRDGTWSIGSNSVQCLLECPADGPAVGSACDPDTDGKYCLYGACPTVMSCGLDRTWEDNSSACM